MHYLTAAQAAAHLGLETRSAYSLIGKTLTNINAGRTGPILIPATEVQQLAYRRRHDALARVGDETTYATTIRNLLHPTKSPQLRADGRPDPASLERTLTAPRGKQALRTLLGGDAYCLWSPDVLQAAAMEPTPGVCRTCWARAGASVHQTRGPDDSESTRVLLGSPCPQDAKAWAAQRRETRQKVQQLRAKVRADADAEKLRRFTTEYRAALADVTAATKRFSAIEKQRKAAGLPIPQRRTR